MSTLFSEWAASHLRRQNEDAEMERVLVAQVRDNCIESLEFIACALRYPRISRSDLERAITSLQKALAAAKELDK